jgi:uncharacterized protein (TIGR00255 family)
MTGFGKAIKKYQDKTIHAEIKTLNSKSMDCSMRIAPAYREKETEIRKAIQDSAVRGKIDFSLWIEKDTTAEAAHINTELAKDYFGQIKTMTQELGIEGADLLSIIMHMPEVITTSEETATELSEEEWSVATEAVTEALNELTEFRKQEGAALRRKFEEKLDNIASLMVSIEPYEQGRVEKIRQRLIDRLQSIPEIEYDRNRLEQEMIFYLEKLDISEEKQRLANHIRYFRESMDEPWLPTAEGGKSQGVGKKLGFIAQEMGREINTTGSKSNQAEMQKIVVQMKDELEQIKEQVLNVL